MDNEYEELNVRCPFCNDEFECAHLLLSLDQTSRCAEAGTLEESFNSKILRSKSPSNEVLNGEEFDYLEGVVRAISDSTIKHSFEGGPGQSYAYENYYVLDEYKSNISESVFEIYSLNEKLETSDLKHKINFDLNFYLDQINDWIQRVEFFIQTAIPVAGNVRNARHIRATHKFLSEYLANSNYFPVGLWQIKIQLPLITKKYSISSNESMVNAINRSGFEIFEVRFPMDFVVSPYLEKLPFATISAFNRLLILKQVDDSSDSKSQLDIESEFNIADYKGSKPISQEWDSRHDIARAATFIYEEYAKLEILSKLKRNGFIDKPLEV